MSEETMVAVQRYFEATNRGDFDAAMAAYADDVVLRVDEGAIPTGAGTFSGRRAVGEWFGDWFRSFARGYRIHVEETQPVGDRVLVVARHEGYGRSSGVAINWSLAYLFTIEAGGIARLEIYRDRASALRGLAPEK